MDFHPSAFKHDIEQGDSAHAIPNAVVIEDVDDGLTLYLGPSRAGAPLEVITLARAEDDDVVIHSMPMRPKYRRLLPGG